MFREVVGELGCLEGEWESWGVWRESSGEEDAGEGSGEEISRFLSSHVIPGAGVTAPPCDSSTEYFEPDVDHIPRDRCRGGKAGSISNT